MDSDDIHALGISRGHAQREEGRERSYAPHTETEIVTNRGRHTLIPSANSLR